MWNLKASIRALASSSLGIIKQKRALQLKSNLVMATTLHTHVQTLYAQEAGIPTKVKAPGTRAENAQFCNFGRFGW